ncbi:2-oxo-4-hydroxy-4-carboxy-5-ureidoimidazoline decarboxylase [Streptomyces sp. NPDC056452]|uniref:2-oxo-4-hydroxy-4-carboxy-5-ureidoimidazoline decarboxylase n=1 Tax=Streptomyces sp. NPDC056452 TaxID=3345821 RepID=UPI0036C5E705
MPAQSRGAAQAEAPVPDPVSASTRESAHSSGLDVFNTWPRELAEAALLECCGSRRWAVRMTAHRPYPDLGAVLAASDEAGYDLSSSDIAEALAAESAPCLHHAAPRAAHLALRAAHAAYESRFGHAFVICLDGLRPSQHVDQVLAAIRTRLAHDPDEERSLTAEEMRRLARGRIIELVTEAGRARSPF